MLKIEDALPGTRVKAIQQTYFVKKGEEGIIKSVYHEPHGLILIIYFNGDDHDTYVHLDNWCEYFEVVK